MEWISYLGNIILDAILGTRRDSKAAALLAGARREPFSSGNVTAILPYRDHAVRQALWLFKYRGNRAVAESCADALWEIIAEEISEELMMRGTKEILVVPIPSSWKKRSKKGFNQTEILAKMLSKKDTTGMLRYSDSVLYKVKDTESQAGIKDRNKRVTNVKDSMEAEGDKAVLKTVFVIDDITTTGSTFKEATRALKAAGAKRVLCFAVAH